MLQVYKVVIWSKNECWHVFRRYNEFYKLSEVLKKQVMLETYIFPIFIDLLFYFIRYQT